MSKLRIEPASVVSQEAIISFLTAHWPRRTALEVPAFYTWQMQQAPATLAEDASLVALDETDQLQGYIGATSQYFSTAMGTSYNGVTTTSIILAPEARGGLLGFNLLKAMMKRYDAMVGMNLNPISQAMLRRLGHHFIRSLERMVRVYNIEPFESLIDWTPGAKNLLALQKPKSLKALPAYKTPSVSELEALFSNYTMPGVSHFDRSFSFLKWRYLEHPIHSFDFLLVEPNNPAETTLLVLRRENHEAFSLAHVLDILPLGNNLPNYSAVLDAYAKEQSLDLIDAMISLPRLTSPLWQAGWLSTINDVDLRLPNLFNPLELRDPPTGNIAIWNVPNLPFLADVGSLYISKADGDFDRPTLEAIQRIKPELLSTAQIV